jgi:hypothetical protein
MTDMLIRTAGFAPPKRSPHKLLHSLVMPEFVAVLTLTLSIAALLTALTWSVGSADKHRPVPVSSIGLSSHTL